MALNRLSSRNFLHVAILALIAGVLFNAYFLSYFRYQYPVPPGDDSLRHMSEAAAIAETGTLPNPVERAAEGNLIPDPPVFHVFMTAISSVTGLDTVTTFQVFARLIAIFVTFVGYFVATKLFSSRAIGLMAVILLALFSPQPSSIYSEGSYLNIVGAHIFFALGLSFLPAALMAKNLRAATRPVIGILIFFIAVYLVHPLSAIYLSLFLVAFGLAIGIKSFHLRNGMAIRRYLVILLPVWFISVPFAWHYYLQELISRGLSLLRLVVSNQGDVESASDALNFLPAQFRSVATIDTYTYFNGMLIFSIGVLGLILLFFYRKVSIYTRLIFVIWAAVLFFGSQTTFLQLPHRFARDLYLPLGICAAFLIYWLLGKISQSRGPRVFPLIAGGAVVLQLLFGPVNFFASASYNGLVRIQDIDQQAMDWIRANTELSDVFLGSPFVKTEWGSYITILTGRKVIDGMLCGANQLEGITFRCDVLYEPNGLEAMKFYRDRNIQYVFAGHPYVCCFLWQDKVHWDFHKTLRQAKFLSRVFVASAKNVGTTAIYKVDHAALDREIAAAERDL